MSTVWLDEQQFRHLSEALDKEDQQGFRIAAYDIAVKAGVDVGSDFHPNLWLCQARVDRAEGRFALTTKHYEEP